MKRFLFTSLLILTTFEIFSQNSVSGKVTDRNTGEPLIGATIIYGKGQGVVTDFEGNYFFSIQSGTRSLKISYVGYEEVSLTIEINKDITNLDFKLKTLLLNEVEVVADIAKERETPVAFSSISVKKINEELASQDIPMVLNSTPGVYATQTGGGEGDARITIRGFNQRNVAVMIDGIPVNDMENGWVYWSNWFGLDAVTSNIQVQRGLGASKIAIPSVGGTMNILTRGTGNKKGGIIKQSVGSFGKLRTTVGYNSGLLKNGWGFTLAGSYKRGTGFVEETWSQGFFYYLKIQKKLGKHILSFSAMGAPQKHGQRSYKSKIAKYDIDYAQSLGDNTEYNDEFDRGINYNKHWGYLDRWTLTNSGDTIHNREVLNTRQNYYHKPQFSLRDFWTINDKLYMSNIVYASIGNGGGTKPANIGEINGQTDLQSAYNGNRWITNSEGEYLSGSYLYSQINNHFWYGGLSTINYNITENIEISAGMDLRYYKGEHYKEIYDLLGGDYAIDNSSQNQFTDIKREKDIIGYHNDGIVKWSGIFKQLEYSNGILSAFLNFSGSNSAYKRIDYFRKKDLVLEDRTIREAVGTRSYFGELVSDTVIIDGKSYTVNSEEAEYASTDWKWIKGYTIKTGANYNLNDFNNIFFNTGYISKAPRFQNIFDYDNKLYNEIENEKVKAFEGGYSYRSSIFSSNINFYYTIWENKPTGGITYTDPITEEEVKANINGLDALHKGIEMDFIYKITRKLSFEGLLSLGDWIWTSSETVRLYDDNNNPILNEFGSPIDTSFNAKGVHVGDAAQTQYGFSLRYEPIYNAYLKLRGTTFSDYYSDFDPLSLYGEFGGTESWVIPSYSLFDLHCGYKLKVFRSNTLDFKFSALNIFDKKYISDAQNNDKYNSPAYNDFDAKSASVFFGFTRRFNISVKYSF